MRKNYSLLHGSKTAKLQTFSFSVCIKKNKKITTVYFKIQLTTVYIIY